MEKYFTRNAFSQPSSHQQVGETNVTNTSKIIDGSSSLQSSEQSRVDNLPKQKNFKLSSKLSKSNTKSFSYEKSREIDNNNHNIHTPSLD